MEGQRIGVIGAGVAGLSAAWLLAKRHRVVLYEKNPYVGGHTRTVEVNASRGCVPVDMGFIVYNERNYPHLSGLFGHLGVSSQPSDMSFSASIGEGALEYSGSSLNTLFAQRRNLLRPAHVSMLYDIVRFNSRAKRLLRENLDQDLTLAEFIQRHRFGVALRDHYLLPMAAAIWSCPPASILRFPLFSLLRFFANHGLLDLWDRPQWRTVVGGSHTYVKRMLRSFHGSVRSSDPVVRVVRDARGVTVHTASGTAQALDQVVLACHADEALKLLDRPRYWESEILRSFQYQENRAVLHSDPGLMPRRRRVWSSWNYLAATEGSRTRAVCVTYWMNRLQRIEAQMPLLVTLNPFREPRADLTVSQATFHHPVFDARAMRAQPLLPRIQGHDRIWYCGSYFGHGFHEDALLSAVRVARSLGVAPPWQLERPVRHPARTAPVPAPAVS
jgi:predicted NAD/FAD-binding protein